MNCGFWLIQSTMYTIQSALISFTQAILGSTGSKFAVFFMWSANSRCSVIWSEYHNWYWSLSQAFATEMSIGYCRLFVFGGTRQVWTLWLSNSSVTASVTCPLKLSILTIAGLSSPCNYWVCSTNGKKTIVYILDQGLLSGLMIWFMGYIPSSWESKGRMTSVGFPFVNNWTDRSSPNKLPKNTALICLLSLIPIRSTLFDPLSPIVHDVDALIVVALSLLCPSWILIKVVFLPFPLCLPNH